MNSATLAVGFREGTSGPPRASDRRRNHLGARNGRFRRVREDRW